MTHFTKSGPIAALMTTTALVAFATLPTPALAQDDGFASIPPTADKWDITAKAYYLFGQYDADFGFGTITPPGVAASGYVISGVAADLRGGGGEISASRGFGDDWYAEMLYRGFHTGGSASAGDRTVDSNGVYGGLFDRSLANIVINSNADDGIFDFASDTVDIAQHSGDLLAGRRFDMGGPLSGFWQAGVRGAYARTQRDLNLVNLVGADLYTFDVSLGSRMWGAGPTVGGGFELALTEGLSLSAAASASTLFSVFDLTRTDTARSPTQTGVRDATVTTYGVVPMVDISLGLDQKLSRWLMASLGYTASVAIGGSRTIRTVGNDDVDGYSAPYAIMQDSILSHGLYFSLTGTIGGDGAAEVSPADTLMSGEGELEIAATAYYTFGQYAGDFGFGTRTPPGTTTGNYVIDARYADLRGGGGEVSVMKSFDQDWYAKLLYRGFLSSGSSTAGDATTDVNGIYANLFDRSLADDTINSFADDGFFDYASESLKTGQHSADLVTGRRIGSGGVLSGFWQAGIRGAYADAERDLNLVNLESGNADRFDVSLNSTMWGAGPTVGGGLDLALMDGLTLSTSASASALLSYFHLNRTDTATDLPANTVSTRDVSYNSFGFVPMVDFSLGLSQKFGNGMTAGLGYTASAAIGGGRSIGIVGFDDVDGDTSPYSIVSDTLFSQGVYFRLAGTIGENGEGVVRDG